MMKDIWGIDLSGLHFPMLLLKSACSHNVGLHMNILHSDVVFWLDLLPKQGLNVLTRQSNANGVLQQSIPLVF